MRIWTHALTLLLTLSAAFPSAATIITGADGPFAPATDYTLPYRADGIFDFTAIDIGSGITVRFDSQMQNVTLLSLGDILIAGVIDAVGINLVLETPGQIVLTGTILADSISLAANSMSLTGDWGVGARTIGGNLCLSRDCVPRIPPSDRLTFPPGTLKVLPGRDISLRAPGAGVFAVPEPATPWLITLLLPMLVLFGRKRT